MSVRNVSKIQICILVFLLLIPVCCLATGKANQKDVVIPAKLTMSDDVSTLYDAVWPNNIVESFSKENNIIFFFGLYRVLNPSKNTFDVDIDCIDSNGTVIFKSKLKRNPIPNTIIDFQRFGEFEVRLGLSPQNKFVQGQIYSLESGNNYLIRVYVEGALVSLTSFHYR